MIRSTVAGNAPVPGCGILACAFALALGVGWAGQARAQALLPVPHAGRTAAHGAAATRVPVKPAPGKTARSARKNKPDRVAAGIGRGRTGAAAPTAAPTVLPVDAVRDWDIVIADKTLNATMARWAVSAGWQLLWELPVDYPVEARTRVHGTLEDAVSTVAQSMAGAEIPMKAVFYQGNRVLRVMAKGSE